ncbi:MAG: thiamine pyrophosphate-dependent enzyme, partial [Dehalococcoidia bacterium]
PLLIALARRFDAPVAAADGGKGAFPEDHPLSLGTALGGRVWGDNPVQEYIASCDAALVVGSSLPFRSTKGVDLDLPGDLVQIDIDSGVFGRNYPVKVGLAGDAKHVLTVLLDAVKTPRHAPAEQKVALAQTQAAIRESVERQFPNELRVWEAIRGNIDRDAVVLCDSTIPGYVATRCFQALEPRTFHHPHGWVSIGYSFAASLGAKTGAPDRQVVCVTGDGGFQYNVQELASAKQYGIAPIVLVFNDNAWGVLQRYQDTRFGGRHFATELSNPDFKALAAAYGVDYALVRNVAELSAALRNAKGRDTLQLIEVLTPVGIANFT